MRSLLFILILVTGLAGTCRAQPPSESDKMELTMHMLQLRNSLITRDSIGLDILLASDVSYGHSNGLMQTKAQLIRSVISREQDYKIIDPSDMLIRVYGSTGIVTMKMHVVMIYEEKPLDLKMGVTLTWIRADKGWKLVARQSVKL